MLAANGSRTFEVPAKQKGSLAFRRTQTAERRSLASLETPAAAPKPRDLPSNFQPIVFSLASRSQSIAGFAANCGGSTGQESRFRLRAKASSPNHQGSPLSRNTRVTGTPLFSPQPSSKRIALEGDGRRRQSVALAFSKKHPNRRFAFQTRQLFLPPSLLHPDCPDVRLRIPGFFDMRNLANPKQQMLVANARDTLYTKVKVDLHGRTAFASSQQRSSRSPKSCASADTKSLRCSRSSSRIQLLGSPGQATGLGDSRSLEHLPASLPQSKREIENIDLQTGFLQQKLATPQQSPAHKQSRFFVRDLIKYTQLAHLGKKLNASLSAAFSPTLVSQALGPGGSR